MAIKDRSILKEGVRLVGTYKKVEYTGVMLNEKNIRVESDPSRPITDYKSLSAAASAIRGSATNGYLFWSVAEPEAAVQDEAPKEAETLPVGPKGCIGKNGTCQLPAQKGTNRCYIHREK